MDTSQISLEKMNLGVFERKYVVIRKSEIPQMIIDMQDTKFQLPDMSTLHMTRGFLDYPVETNELLPDSEFPPLVHESLRKYLYFQTEIPTAKSRPFPVVDRYQYIPSQFKGIINHYFSTHNEFHRTFDRVSVDKSTSLLSCIEYSPILRTVIRGPLWEYRKFDIWLRTVLETIVNTQFARHHFVHVPLSPTLYTMQDYNKPLQRITQSTLKHITDPSFYFLIHVLGYIFNGVFKHERVDVPLNDVGYLTKKDMTEWETDSLFNRLTELKQNEIYILFTHGNHALIYHLPYLRNFASSSTFETQIIRQINLLKLVGSKAHTVQELTPLKEQEIDTLIEHSKQEEKEKKETPQEETPLEKEEETSVVQETPVGAPKAPTPFKEETPKVEPLHKNSNAYFLKSLNEGTAKAIEKAKGESVNNKHDPVVRAQALIQTHMNITIGGKTIGEHLVEPPPPLEPNTLTSIENHLPDKGMAKSTITDFDKTYLKHVAMKDMCRVLTSFNKSGLFIQDVKETQVHDKFNRYTDYHIKMVGLDGRQHTVRYQLPNIDENGTMLVNGIKSRMIKQNTDVPICKISENRVSLASNYNKTIVQRTETVAHSFSHWITKYMLPLINNKLIQVGYGKLTIDHVPLPYDYQVLAQKYLTISFQKYVFHLDYPHRFDAVNRKEIEPKEKTYGVFCGMGDGGLLFWDRENLIHQVHQNKVVKSFYFMELLSMVFGDKEPLPKCLSEWCEVKILDLNIPIVFVLGFEYGLKHILKYVKLNYRFVPNGERAHLKVDEIPIRFADGTLIFSRYPLKASLIASGLGKWDLSAFSFTQFDAPDGYYSLLESRNIKVNYLKGIAAFYEFFIDPITEEVLMDMGEPTNLKDLFIRAVEMLTDMSYYPTASMRHHRLRGYERLSAFLYNEVSRELSAYKEKKNKKSGFSINPKAVFNRIVSDQTIQNVDTINPVHELKNQTAFTYSGHNGRTGQSFVMDDRVYAKDAVGIISESTLDSGKVSMNAYTSVNPRLKDIRGLCHPYKEGTELDPTQMISAPALLIPGTTQDDGKRANFVGIQLSHHVPCENAEVGFVRTGFELTVAHRVSNVFAASAPDEGKVISFNEKTKVFVVKYQDTLLQPNASLPAYIKGEKVLQEGKKNGNINLVIRESEVKDFKVDSIVELNKQTLAKVLNIRDHLTEKEIPPTLLNQRPDLVSSLAKDPHQHFGIVTLHLTPHKQEGEKKAYYFGDQFTSVSGSHIKQHLEPLVKLGDTVHKGDILMYNTGFFTPEPRQRQVRWNQGVLATVALIEKAETLEDGSVISKNLGEKLRMSPAHKRTINIVASDVVRKIVKLGEEVESTDPLMVFEDAELGMLSADEDESAAFWRALDQKAPKSRFHGYIAEIEVYHACDFNHLSPSIQQIVREVQNRAKAIKHSADGAHMSHVVETSCQIPLGTKYSGVEFTEETVLFEFTIAESLHCGVGDKIVIGGPNKSVVSSVMEKPFYTESGIPIDVLYGCTSTAARIVNSPYIMGMGNRIGRELQKKVVDLYFK